MVKLTVGREIKGRVVFFGKDGAQKVLEHVAKLLLVHDAVAIEIKHVERHGKVLLWNCAKRVT